MHNKLAETMLILSPIKTLFFMVQLYKILPSYNDYWEVIQHVKQINPKVIKDAYDYKVANGYGQIPSEMDYDLAKQQPEWDEVTQLINSTLTRAD